MIRVGPLSRARLRAACYALRVRWVEDLEAQRDEAWARLAEVENERDQALRTADDAAEVCGSHELARADAEHRTEGAEAERDAAMNTIGQIAAELGLLGAPQRFNVPAIHERIRLLVREHGARCGVELLGREAYDPAMGGDIEPPPGRVRPFLGCTCSSCQELRAGEDVPF